MQDGSIQARPELLLEHANFVRALARRLVGSAGEAEDLEQDAWLAALRERATIEPDPRGWFTRALRNRASSERRSERRRRRREHDASRARSEASIPDPAELAANLEIRQRVVEAVLALDEPYRSTIILRYEQELSPSAIAHRTGVSVDTVKTRLRRALEQLRDRLDREAGGDRRKWLAALAPLLDDAVPVAARIGLGILPLAAVAIVASLVALVAILAFALRGSNSPSESHAALDPNAVPAAVESGTDASSLLVTATQPNTTRHPVGTPPGTVTVRIVDEITREPIAGAEVWCAGVERALASRPTRELGISLPEIGTLQLTDADGNAAISFDEDAVCLFARRAHRAGLLGNLGADEPSPVELGISPHRSLDVLVTEHNGTPIANAHVQLHGRCSHEQYPLDDRIVTNAHGIAHFHGYERRITDIVPETPVKLFLGQPLATAAREIDLTPGHLPDDPIRLPLSSPYGQLAIEIGDADGQPFDGESVVTVAGSTPEGLVQPLSTIVYGPRAVFPVGLDQRLTVAISTTTSPHSGGGTTHTIEGPREAGETVRLAVTTRPPVARLVGVLADENGIPLADRDLAPEWTVREGDARFSLSAARARTDEGGRFDLPVCRSRPSNVPEQVEIAVASDPGHAPRLTRITLPAELDPVSTDVGEVTATVPPLSLRGRVVDEGGNGLPGALVSIEAIGRPNQETLKGLGYVGEASPEPRNLLDLFTDHDGRFEARRPAGEGTWSIRVAKQGHTTRANFPFSDEGDEVEVVLPRAGAIVGSLHLLRPEDALDFSIRLATSPSPGRSPYATDGGHLDRGGWFRFRRVEAGRHRIEVALRGQKILEIDDVLVEPGEICLDPRLQGIDLSAAVRELQLDIVDPEGLPVAGGLVDFHARGENAHRAQPVPFYHGHLRHLVREGTWTVKVAGPGFREVEVAKVADVERVVLDRGIRRSVVLPEGMELPPDPWCLHLYAATKDRHRLIQALEDPGGTFELSLPHGGPWQLAWVVAPREWSVEHHPVGQATVEITEDPELVTLDFPLDAEEYARILDELR